MASDETESATALETNAETEDTVPNPGLESELNLMRTFTQTKCEAKRLELLKAASENLQNMSRGNLSNTINSWVDSVQLNVLCPCLKDVVLCAVPATFPDRGHFTFTREDFQSLTEKTEVVLTFINSLLEICNQNLNTLEPRQLHECLAHLVIILSTNMRNNLWSTDVVQNITLRVLNQLRILYKVDSLSELLQLDLKNKDRETATPNSRLLGQYLNVVKVRLTRDEWQANPTFVESFVWMLTQMMKFPHLSDYLDLVLPPALMFIDSHVTEQRVVGIQCLQHIAANVTKEELRWYGRADVVYAALKQQIYAREPEIIRYLHPALLTVLPIIDTSPASKEAACEALQTDSILSTVMSCAITENSLLLRRLYTQCIPDYVSYLGERSVKHLRGLVELVSTYLEVCDAPGEEARFNALNIMCALLENAWPCVPIYVDQVVRIIMTLFLDLGASSMTSESVKNDLCAKAWLCLERLRQMCPDVQAYLDEVVQTPELNDLASRIHGLQEENCVL